MHRLSLRVSRLIGLLFGLTVCNQLAQAENSGLVLKSHSIISEVSCSYIAPVRKSVARLELISSFGNRIAHKTIFLSGKRGRRITANFLSIPRAGQLAWSRVTAPAAVNMLCRTRYYLLSDRGGVRAKPLLKRLKAGLLSWPPSLRQLLTRRGMVLRTYSIDDLARLVPLAPVAQCRSWDLDGDAAVTERDLRIVASGIMLARRGITDLVALAQCLGATLEPTPASSSSSSSSSPSSSPSLSPSSSTSSSSVAPLTFLVPGAGFSGAITQPPQIGSGPAATQKAIARWDVVPEQIFDETINVGVVAFHINGIDHVSFMLNGGPPLNVTEMTLNPETNVVEYWATIRAADVPDGPIELRAIAYPKIGVPRVLQARPTSIGEGSLFLHANFHHSLSAGTIYVSPGGSNQNHGTLTSPYGPLLDFALDRVPDGGTIVLLDPGIYFIGGEAEHRSPRQVNYYVTVKANAGLAASDVRIQAKRVLGYPTQMVPQLSKLHWQGVRFDMDTGQYTPMPGALVWFDRTYWTFNGWQNTDFLTPIAWTNPIARSYITDTFAYNGVYGTVGFFFRNCVNDKISGSPFLAPELLINSSVSNFNSDWISELPTPPASPYHRDIWHSWWGPSNTIAYGVTATNNVDATPIRIEGAAPLVTLDNAFIDWNVVTKPVANPPFANWGHPYVAVGTTVTNLLFKNFHAPNNRWTFHDNDPLVAEDFSIQDSGFHWATFDSWILYPETIPPGVSIINQGNYKASFQDWAPRNLIGTSTPQGNLLQWQNGGGTTNLTSNDAFIVRRSDDNGASWSAITSYLSAATLAYADQTAQAGHAYLYVIQSINWPSGANEYSNVVKLPN